jgi:hypothetical protein
MPQFSTYFGLNLNQAQLDFVDVDTDTDKQLFIDPHVFANKPDAWSATCHETLISFFETLLQAMGEGDHEKGRRLLDNLGEPNETCLGLWAGRPAGRGIGRLQADSLYERIRTSKAAATGILSELSDCELFIEGVGADKISDITTNIIRRHLIEYTQYQCDLHGIELVGTVASGFLWNTHRQEWEQDYVRLPVIGGRKIILTPKAAVRWKLAFSHPTYYNHFVLNYLQAEHLRQNTALVRVLRSGERRVRKKDLKKYYPMEKNFLSTFSEEHPEVLERYKTMLGIPRELGPEELQEGFDECVFADSLSAELVTIQRGSEAASRFHHFMIGALEFIFYPDLIYPIKENEIHEGRKRIDILYTNNSMGGFFFRRRAEAAVNASHIIVECKNYMKEMDNPELDQIAGRFAPQRGRLGFADRSQL